MRKVVSGMMPLWPLQPAVFAVVFIGSHPLSRQPGFLVLLQLGSPRERKTRREVRKGTFCGNWKGAEVSVEDSSDESKKAWGL
jgi:hypothetical protein